MKSLLPALLFAITLAGPAFLLSINASALDDTLNIEAKSSVLLTKENDRVRAVRVQNTRFVPYRIWDAYSGSQYRLVTIATNVALDAGSGQIDLDAVVNVTVDDMNGEKTQRLTSFKDPGQDGAVIADRYFATTTPDFWGDGDTHHVRWLDTGQYLFQSLGRGPTGITAWAEFPNKQSLQIRWAALGPAPNAVESDAGVIGTIMYGNDNGPLSTVLIAVPQQQAQDGSLDMTLHGDMWLALTKGARLLWIDSQEKAPTSDSPANAGPSSGTPDSPKNILSLTNVTDPAQVTGLALALELDGKRLISIPVEGDKLMAKKTIINHPLLLVQGWN